MTRIAPGWLTAPETQAVVAALSGHAPHFVGGCVRDALLGMDAADVDIAVSCPPDETLQLAAAAGLAGHPTGIDHGVVTIVSSGKAFQVATFRRDVATDGRHAIVAYSDRIEDDAARRDFTMNALYALPDGRVVDPLGIGLDDLKARRIRFIGDPVARICEDYLRILRFFRFHAQLGIDSFDPAGMTAARAEARGLDRIAVERIGAEMMKLLGAPDPDPALAAMGDLLTKILPGAVPVRGLARLERAQGVMPDPIRRLSLLGVEAEVAADHLRLSRADAARLAAVHAALADATPLRQLAYRHGADAARDAVLIHALHGSEPPAGWQAQIAEGAAAVFPMQARDLIADGAEPGPALGDALRRLESAWVASDFALTKSDLMARWQAWR